MKRILTAVVALPILLYTVWSQSPYFFVGLTTIAIVLALAEFCGLAAKVGCKPQIGAAYAAALVVVASFVFEEPALAVAVLAGLSIWSLAAAVFKPGDLKTSLVSVSATVFGVVYVALLASCLVGVRMIADTAPRAPVPHLAAKLLTTFFAIVMMTDTGAFYTGRMLGRHKLAPRVSPGKTIEGAIGGFLTAIAAGVLCKLTFFPEIPIAHVLVLGAALGAIGQIGDLAESLLKRGSNVKDSGNLLPGHGGMLDRIDSLLFCAPLLYFYSRVFVSGL
ncbi:MAG TPA: phosphatidate cytidylyltransferase [Blastocatellia bacterium]|jgi:CDP-diglyceride synthetase|nr:phosphatidate cytidylyltransferase [Blastocatellia bacterium]